MITLSYIKSDYYSHKNKKLVDHLYNVGYNSKKIYDEVDIENQNLYMELSFRIGLCHDFAKSTEFFQEYLFERIRTDKKNHGRLSAIFGYYVIKNYLNKKSLDENNYPVLAYLVINRHHGNLLNVKGPKGEDTYLKKNKKIIEKQIENIYEQKNKNYAAFNKLYIFYKNYNINIIDFILNYEEVYNEILKKLITISNEKNIKNYEDLLLFYSVLLDSDKLDASNTPSIHRKEIPSKVLSKYRETFDNKCEGINVIRDQAYQEVSSFADKININENQNQKIYSLTLPTGIGKTLDILSFALHLRERIYNEKGIIPRIIYALPFLSIIDQNSDVIEKILNKSDIKGSNYLLKHTSLTDYNYDFMENKISEDEDYINYNSAELLIDGWYSEIVITTFVQFFYTIISNKNKSLRKFHNLFNSIIILDEVQAIPPKYWNILKNLLKQITNKYHAYIIFMTATQPLIFDSDEIQEIISDNNRYIEQFDRMEYHFHKTPVGIHDFCKTIVEEINENEGKDILIVLNSISSSKKIYEYISEKLMIDVDLVYLSTNIIPLDRVNRIKLIKKPSNKQKIIVSTQLIEAGVDIDVDIIYRDQAPLDSIIQTAGRCNRNNKREKGIVHIIDLRDDNNRRFTGIYDSFLMNKTRELINSLKIISEREFNKTIPHLYYKKVKEIVSEDESRKLLDKIKRLDLTNLQNEFKLIENDENQVDVFIEKDDCAKKLWYKYNEIMKSDEKYKFKTIKADFYKYVIHVYKNNLGTTDYNEEKGIGYISIQDLERKYDNETGFIIQDEEGLFSI